MVMELIQGASDLGMFIDKTIKRCLLEYDLSDTEAVLDNMVSGWPEQNEPGTPQRHASQQCTCRTNSLTGLSEAGPLRRMTSECSTISQTSGSTPDDNDVVEVESEEQDLNSAPSKDDDEDKALHQPTEKDVDVDKTLSHHTQPAAGIDKLKTFFHKPASCPELAKPRCSPASCPELAKPRCSDRISRESTPERCSSSSPDPRFQSAKPKSRFQMRYLGDSHLVAHDPCRDRMERTVQIKDYTANRLRGFITPGQTGSPIRCPSSPDSRRELDRKRKINEDHIDVLVEGILGPIKRKTGYGMKRLLSESTMEQKIRKHLHETRPDSDVMDGPEPKHSRLSLSSGGKRDGLLADTALTSGSFDFIVPTQTSKVAALLESGHALDLTAQRHGSKSVSPIERDPPAIEAKREKETVKSDLVRPASPTAKDSDWLPSALATLLPDFERLMGVDPRNLMSQNLIRQLRQYRKQQLLREQHRQRHIKVAGPDLRDKADDEDSVVNKGKNSPALSIESRGSKISSIIAEELQSDGGSVGSGYDYHDTRAALRLRRRQAEVLADGRDGHHDGSHVGADRRCRSCHVPIPLDTRKEDARVAQHGGMHAVSCQRPERPTLLRNTFHDYSGRPVDHRAMDHRAVDHRAVDHRAMDHRAVEKTTNSMYSHIPHGHYEVDRSHDRIDAHLFPGAHKTQSLETSHHPCEDTPYVRGSMRRPFAFSPYHRQHFHRLQKHPLGHGARYADLHDGFPQYPYQQQYPLRSSSPQFLPSNLMDKLLLDEKHKIAHEMSLRPAGRHDVFEEAHSEYRRRAMAVQHERLLDASRSVEWETYRRRAHFVTDPPLPHDHDIPPSLSEEKLTSHRYPAHVRDHFRPMPPPLLPHLLRQPPLVPFFENSPPPSHRTCSDHAPVTTPTQSVLLPSHHPRNQLNHLTRSPNYTIAAEDQPEDLSKKSKETGESTKRPIPAHNNLKERRPVSDVYKTYQQEQSAKGDTNNNNNNNDNPDKHCQSDIEKQRSPVTVSSPVEAWSPRSPTETSPRTREADTTTNNTDTTPAVTPINLTKLSKTTNENNDISQTMKNVLEQDSDTSIVHAPCNPPSQSGPLDLGIKKGANRGYCSNPGSPFNTSQSKPVGRLTP